MNEVKRKSNFELLKIILILMVIAVHYFNNSAGGVLSNVDKWSINYFVSHFFESMCIIAVNTFIIITGYFSYKKNSIKLSKVIKLYSIAIFYGVIISFIIILITHQNINKELIVNFLEAVFSKWFVVIYCILYLLIPFINKFINSISKKNLETLLIINLIAFYLWPTFFTDTTIVDHGYGIINFINLYMIGAYINLYKNDYKNSKFFILIYVLCTIVTTIYSFVAGRAWAYSTIFNLIASISLFMIFKSIEIKSNKIINSIATYIFPIYIIHANTFFIKILYIDWFKTNMFWNSNFMIFHMILTIFGIFAICCIIEWLRRLIIKKIFDNQIEKINFEIKCN